MEFRKMLKTLYAEQKKRHRFIEQSFRLCGRRRGCDVSREQHHHWSLLRAHVLASLPQTTLCPWGVLTSPPVDLDHICTLLVLDLTVTSSRKTS